LCIKVGLVAFKEGNSYEEHMLIRGIIAVGLLQELHNGPFIVIDNLEA
jgi:hypothetical protein